jgi:hypothetical protein
MTAGERATLLDHTMMLITDTTQSESLYLIMPDAIPALHHLSSVYGSEKY